MDWRTYYKEHTMTPEQAVSVIHDGDRVVFGHAVGEPIIFQRTMARMAEQFHNVEVAHMVYLGSGEYLQPGMESHFRHNALFVGGPARKPIAEHRADYTPVFFSDVPRMFRDNTLPVDVFAFTCSPPDERGYVSLGLSCDYGAQAVKSAKTVIAEVNPNMPRTYGESFVHVSEIDGFLCSWEPLPESKPPRIGEEDRAIGKYIAELVRDGDCLQLGIGAVPDAVCSFLGDKHDLGLHTEMISDGVLPLLENGNINGKRKQRDIGKVSVTFLMGTRKLYDFVDNNPIINMRLSRRTTTWFPLTPASRSICRGRSVPRRSVCARFPASAARWTLCAAQTCPRAAVPSLRCTRPPRTSLHLRLLQPLPPAVRLPPAAAMSIILSPSTAWRSFAVKRSASAQSV